MSDNYEINKMLPILIKQEQLRRIDYYKSLIIDIKMKFLRVNYLSFYNEKFEPICDSLNATWDFINEATIMIESDIAKLEKSE